MQPDRGEEARKLFDTAVNLAPGHRADLLADRCADPELRAEVERLLHEHDTAGEAHGRSTRTNVPQRVLSPGQVLANRFRIVRLAGRGGMGKVYEARDIRLDRRVALKFLPEEFVLDRRTLERFEREARAIAALNHPHICAVYDIGTYDSWPFLIMEYVEGETLECRLRKGPLPLEEVLRCGIEIAGALEQAHRHGVIHRDLKPANIMLTRAGAKVLDFGVAKVSEKTASAGLQQPATTLTQDGAIVGTLQYMAPEQLEGKPVDARTDIFAFGAVLYEMTTGRKAFEGGSQASLIAAIMSAHPRSAAPGSLNPIVDKCLAKEPAGRFQSAGDLAWALKFVTAVPATVPRTRSRWWLWIAIGASALIPIVLVLAYITRDKPQPEAVRFSFSPPVKAIFAQPAISPDGRRLAFTEETEQGERALWLRPLDSLTAHKLPGTDDAREPFWSPDGRFIGFISNGKLKKIDISGEQFSVQTICSSGSDRAGAWSPSGVILFQPALSGMGLYRVSASGGTPVAATRLSPNRQEITHRHPQFLPDGRHFLYWVWSASEEYTGIHVGSLDSDQPDDRGPLLSTYRQVAYGVPGYLLFLRGSALMAQRFDPGSFRLIGDVSALPERVGTDLAATGRALFSVSASGALAYQEAAPLPVSRLMWLDRSGKLVRRIEVPAGGGPLSLAPDQRHLAFEVLNELDIEDVWVMDLERGISSRLTPSAASNQRPIWSPDGRRIVFRSNCAAVYDLYAKDAGGLGNEDLIVKSEHQKEPRSWSSDGRFIAYDEADPKTNQDIWILALAGDRKPFPFLRTEFNEGFAKFSPITDRQGRPWIAYVSDEMGRPEVYLRPFSGVRSGASGAVAAELGAKERVSTAGGAFPEWRKDGRELFYVTDKQPLAVDVNVGVSMEAGPPHVLFDLPQGSLRYTPFADGRRFLFIAPAGDFPPAKINVVLNWAASLKR